MFQTTFAETSDLWITNPKYFFVYRSWSEFIDIAPFKRWNGWSVFSWAVSPAEGGYTVQIHYRNRQTQTPETQVVEVSVRIEEESDVRWWLYKQIHAQIAQLVAAATPT